ncbi:DUF4391 domain-containing protein [Mammaliicoccus sciuri]|uniref:DUF4391 domain-containing protein n=1 Tax=Mammaliicoccus sciuri TaxID=1296 RepID=A0AAI8GUV2_MAMSC|nr:DUF4391 domain-containing protein [Mammaliicoccus sciuri]ASE35446.1 hypothetical protein CEP64_12915 [Mammaliicoccus sciuri]
MIIKIPPQAKVNRIIPKDRFSFKDARKIERIRWMGKLSQNTINLPVKKIVEIEIISVDMQEFEQAIVKEIANKIPQEILFIINDNRAVMIYNNQIFSKKVNNIIQISGLSIDDVRDNFIRQLLDITDISKPLNQQVEIINEIQTIEIEINRINKHIKRTLQINKKQSMARKRFELEQQLAKLKGE